MSAPLLLAAAAAALLLAGGKKPPAVAPPSAPRGVVKLGTPTVIKRPAKPAPAKPGAKAKARPSDAVQAAQLAEKQLGGPKATQSVNVSRGTAQVVPGNTLPPGYSGVQATQKAQPTADHLRTRKGKYDRAVLQSFQTAAGLKADGLYGPQTAAALKHFGAKNVPHPLFKGAPAKYAPPAGG